MENPTPANADHDSLLAGGFEAVHEFGSLEDAASIAHSPGSGGRWIIC
jgi:hypothetical protein